MGRKIQFLEPIQQAECGLCCVGMLLGYYKAHYSLVEIRNKLEIGRDGTSIKQLEKLLQGFGMKTEIHKLPVKYLELEKLPVILYWENRHFVVLEKIKRDRVYIADPEYGKVKITLDELEEKYSGYVLTAVPGGDFRKKRREFSAWKNFVPVILANKKRYFKVLLISIVSYFLIIASPILMQNIVDNVAAGKMKDFLSYLCIFCAFIIVNTLVTLFKSRTVLGLRAYLDKAINNEVIERILKVPYKFFETRNNSDIIYNINSCAAIRELFAVQVINGLLDIGAVLFLLIYIMIKNYTMGLVIAGIFGVNLIYIIATHPIVAVSSKGFIVEQSKTQGLNVEIIYSMLGIKMSSIENDIYQNWKLQFDKYQKKYISSEKVNNVIYAVMSALEVTSPLVVLLIGIYMVMGGKISIGMALAFYSLSSTFFSLASSVFNTYWSFIKSNIYVERLNDIIACDDEDIGKNKMKCDVTEGRIMLKNVSFSYNQGGVKVLDNISIEIEKGEKIAIVGASGCGKSTLAKIIVGLYKPTNGTIYYDGVAADKIDMGWLRKQFGIVPQDVTLFNKSIYENISMRREVTKDKVIKAAKIAKIHEEIMSMPMQYNTLISDLGMNLSGGQRQRIIMARAILDNPKVLILDEATSALDNINEAELSEYFKKQGCTQIIVAHRLSTIKNADKIFVLNDGRVVEYGRHEELLGHREYYYRLYNAG